MVISLLIYPVDFINLCYSNDLSSLSRPLPDLRQCIGIWLHRCSYSSTDMNWIRQRCHKCSWFPLNLCLESCAVTLRHRNSPRLWRYPVSASPDSGQRYFIGFSTSLSRAVTCTSYHAYDYKCVLPSLSNTIEYSYSWRTHLERLVNILNPKANLTSYRLLNRYATSNPNWGIC